MKRRFQIGVFLLLGSYILGGVGYKVLSPETPFLDCLYMSVITVTTVGYGEVIVMDDEPALRSYTLASILIGVGVMLYAVAVVTAFIVEGDLNQNFWKRRMQHRIDSLTGHFIVCGAGDTGQRIIEEFLRTDREFVVIDPDPKAVTAVRTASNASQIYWSRSHLPKAIESSGRGSRVNRCMSLPRQCQSAA
jgi:voltage-gated potassium channel